jgi:hypothetical protein
MLMSTGGEATGKDPTIRGKLGTKRYLVVDRMGLPLAVTTSQGPTCMIRNCWKQR